MTSLKNLEIFTLTFYAVMAIITVAANGTVILSMVLIKSLRNTSNYFIVSLSCADFCIGLLTLPLRSMEILKLHFTCSIQFCRVAHVFTLFNFTASVSNLVVITIDRYIAIIHPYTYFDLKRSPRYICGMIFSAWLPVILLTFLPVYGWGSNGVTGDRKGNKGICIFRETMEQDFLLTVLVVVLATSFFVIVPLYGRIFVVAKSKMVKVRPLDEHSGCNNDAAQMKIISYSYDVPGYETSSSTQNTENNNKRQRRIHEKRKNFLQNWKSAKTMFLIVVIFFISWIAFVIPSLMFIIEIDWNNGTVVLASTVIIYAGSAANPFVYFIRFKSFQTEIKRIWKKRFCCRS